MSIGNEGLITDIVYHTGVRPAINLVGSNAGLEAIENICNNMEKAVKCLKAAKDKSSFEKAKKMAFESIVYGGNDAPNAKDGKLFYFTTKPAKNEGEFKEAALKVSIACGNMNKHVYSFRTETKQRFESCKKRLSEARQEICKLLREGEKKF